MPEAPLTIRLFGPLEVRLRGEPLPHLPTRKVAWALALLVLRHDRALERDWLAGTLWPDSAADRASYYLRRGLSQLRRALGAEAWRITTPTRHAVSLDLSGAEVDLVCFDEALQRGDADSLARAVAVYGGPLLEGCTEEWVLPEREAREQAYLGALERLASELLSGGDAGSAVAHLRRAVAVDPLREGAQRMLLEALAAQGEYGEAVQSYRTLRLLLWDELRTEPSPETRAVYERMREEARGSAHRDVSRARRGSRYSSVPPAALLPPIWNVPHRRNPDFTGRDELLADIEASLASDGHAALTQAIVGLGGIGKTQLALEYAYRHAGDYQAVWWVRSEEPAQLAADYAALATPLELPERTASDQGAIVAAARRWLERNTGWLLILDNAPGPEAVADHLPRAGAGHVLITSRDQNWGGMAAAVEVPVLPQEEAVAFLGKRTGWSGPEVGALAEELGRLPLALEQAAAYAAATGCSVTGYLELFRSRRQALLQRGKARRGYRGTVASTWSLSMAEAAAQCPAAAGLLSLCAYLAPDHIPLSFVQEGAEFFPEPLAEAARDPLLLHDAVAALRRYSLVNVHQEALSVHRLVQAVVRDGLSKEEQEQWALAAVRAVNLGLPQENYQLFDTRFRPACALLLPHGLAATQLAMQLVAAEEVAALLYRVGIYVASVARFEQAQACFATGVEYTERALGAGHLRLVGLLVELSELAEDARPLRERAVAVLEGALGREHVHLTFPLLYVARALCREGDDLGARALCERAVAVAERGGNWDGGVAWWRRDYDEEGWARLHLAHILVRLGDLPGARAQAEQGIAAMAALCAADYPTHGWGHVVLAYVLGQQSDFRGERDELGRALDFWESVYGTGQGRPVMCLLPIGLYARPAFGDLTGARGYLERALALTEADLGPDHPRTACFVLALARLLQFSADPAAARPLAERALAMAETARARSLLRRSPCVGWELYDFVLGGLWNLHVSVRGSLTLLGSVLLDLGDLAAAQSYLERAATIGEEVVGEWSGPDYEGVAEVLPTVGRLRRLQGRLEEAKACLEQSLATPEHLGPPHQWRMAATHLEYGLALQEMGNLATAREHLQQAIGMFERRLGSQHPRTEQARRELAALDTKRA